VKCAIIEQEEMEAGGSGGGKVVEEELKALSIEDGEFQEEARARERFNGPLQGETLEAVGGRHTRVEAARGEPTTQNGEESTPPFVLYPPAPLLIAVLLGTR
jgi:hypothetical protein